MDPKNQAKESGLALVLACLVIGLHTNQKIWYLISAAILILLMAVPQAFSPLGRVWFGCSKVLGNIVSKILLTFVYIIIIAPLGALRRVFGADPMRLKQWKRGTESVFQERRHRFARDDFKNAY